MIYLIIYFPIRFIQLLLTLMVYHIVY